MRCIVPSILIILLFAPGFLKADCLSLSEFKSVSSAWTTTELENYALELENCPAGDTTLAECYHVIGIRYYSENNYEKAIAATAIGLNIRKKILAANDYDLGRSYHNLGTFQQANFEFHLAEINLKNAADIFRETGRSRVVGDYLQLAAINRERGDFGRALNFIDLAISNSIYFDELPRLGAAYLDCGQVLLEMNEPERAIDSLRKAEIIFSGLTNKSTLVKENEAACYGNIAFAMDELGNFEDALKYNQKALEILKIINPDIAATVYSNISVLYRKTGRPDLSRQALNSALLLSKGNPVIQATCFDNYGDLDMDAGKIEEALSWYNKAIQTLLPDWLPPKQNGKKIYLNKPSPELLSDALDKADLLTYISDKAEAWVAYYNQTSKSEYLNEALENYILADHLIDRMRFEQSTTTSKLFWRKKAKIFYESALEVCFLLNESEIAFYFLEKSKAALLLDALLAIDARKIIPDSVAEKELRLQNRLLAAGRQKEDAVESGIDPNEKLERTTTEYENFIRDLSSKYPRYHQIKYATSVISVDETSTILQNPGSVLFSFFWGNEHIYLVGIQATNSHIFRIGSSDEISGLVLPFLEYFKTASAIGNDPFHFAAAGYALFEKIIPPQFLNEKEISKLLILPDGLLSFLPFEALVVSSYTGQNFSQFPFLIKESTIRYGYSATVLALQNVSASETKRISVRAFAPFDSESSGSDYLKYSELEIYDILKLAEGKKYMGEKASMENFRNEIGFGQVLHLSTHASGSPESGDPYVAFFDGKLELDVLYGLQIPSELVVLSACETGLGEYKTGEGVMSLARGFTFAGTRSLVSSLWKVNDAATAYLSTRFYKNLLAGHAKATALRRAKLDYISDGSISNARKSPFYWAGLVFVGADGGLKFERGTGFPKWLFALGLIFIGLMVVWMVRVKR